MVKVALLNAESPQAGEIIRILVNHPETLFSSLHAPLLAGRNLSSLHHGLIGESQYNFTDKFNPEEADVVIAVEKSDLSDNLLSKIDNFEDLKFIGLDKEIFGNIESEAGLSEINRKALVRGARLAYVPSPSIVPALIALNPLANFLLLNSDIDISVTMPEDIVKATDVKQAALDLQRLLAKSQSSFNGDINLIINPAKEERGSVTEISFNNSLSLDEIEKIYEGIYDDHNFTFLTRNDVGPEEVVGTQKTVIYLKKPESDTLYIKIVADARLRGGAGDVVHVLNLFFGLHEKTGLTFKPSRFHK